MAKSEPITAADGTPLKVSLNRALRRQKLRALALIAPLLIFILASFVMPIADMLFRSVENQIVSDTLPRTTDAMRDWTPEDSEIPPEEVFAALYTDLSVAVEYKTHTRLGSRLNYELSGASSLFRKSGRGLRKFGIDAYRDAFAAADPAYEEPDSWAVWMGDDDIREALPLTTDAYDAWAAIVTDIDGDLPAEEDLADFVYAALYRDIAAGAPAPVPATAEEIEPISFKAQFADIDEDWVAPEIWATMKTYAPAYTNGYFLNSVDLQKGIDGPQARPANEQIYVTLFIRTLIMSLAIMGMCVLLGYPIAWLLANLPDRKANLLMILVLLPFWTSLLVRTSAWKVLLQQQGVINDVLVWIGLVADGDRLQMINNQTGTIIAMTHILLPFMILPLYSVMKTIPPSYLRAAKSLGATDWTAFWRVYFPQSVPGIGAGCILVFILSIGYYITPELVGGTKGVFISNRIAYHISSSLNWGLAAALGTILLAAVLLLYWAYDRLVGIDNVKLGG